MLDQKADFIFPEDNENRMNEEMFWRINNIFRYRGLEGHKRFFWILLISLKALAVLSILKFAFTVRDDPDKLVVCVATSPAILMAVLKLIYMHFRPGLVRYLLNTIHEFWDMRITGPKIRNDASTRFLIINLFLLGQTIVAMICILLSNISPLLEMEGVKPLPNPIWVPFDTNPSPLYEIVYAFLVCNQFLTLGGNFFYNFTYTCAIQHLCVQLALLRKLLENITAGIMADATDLEKFHSAYFQTKVKKRLKICIQHHYKLLRYGKNIDKFTSNVLVPQLIMTYMALVINGFILTSDKDVSFKFLELSLFSALMFAELVALAVQASDLKEHSIAVVDAVCGSEWNLFKAPTKKSLVIMMLNAKKGISITVGGVITVDNPLILEILQKVFSAITLLKALLMETGTQQ